MSEPPKADCRTCRHFRAAPYEAKQEGCYLPSNMKAKQKNAFLDEQKIPGDHEAINRNGDCPDFVARAPKLSLLKRLFSLGA